MEKQAPRNEINNNSEVPTEEKPLPPKKPVKPPKIEDKPFEEFINNYFIPGLKQSIIDKGSEVLEI